jgi:tRNA threonylcarbamoyladenosine modification (KEOPS) complex  Pcc1 subunit
VTEPRWTARFTVRLDSPESADRLLAALGPEASREVPKTSAVLGRPSPSVVSIDVRASDPGALRAAANTYLGWVDLAQGAEAVARRAAGAPPVPKPLSP